MKINLINGKIKEIGNNEYLVKSDKCKHRFDEYCENCEVWGSEILNLGGLK